MLLDMEIDDDLVQRRLQHLEHRYRRVQNTLAAAQANYASIREVPGVGELQLSQAQLRVQRAQQQLTDVQRAIELLEDQG